jgi:hypothetical protein
MITVPTERHTQNNKDHGRRPVTRRLKRAREKKRETDSETDSEGRNLKRRGPGGHESYGPRGSPTDSVGSREGRRAAAGRLGDEGGASLKETRSIGPASPAKDTLSDRTVTVTAS